MAAKSLQFHFRRQTYQFNFKVGFTLLCLFLFIVCVILGVWQLHRYTHKKILLTTYHNRIAAKPISFNQIANLSDLSFQRVEVSGNYVNELIMLVQNRFYHDQQGFEVLTPIHIPGDTKLLLVDRGWIAKSNAEDIKPVKEKQKITGYIKLLDEYQFILGNNILQPHATPIILQRIDINEISKATEQAFYPFIVRLDAAEPHGFVRDWIISAVTPERHLGYAVQWFALALILLISYFCFCCERQDE